MTDIVDELRADKLPGDRSYVRDARAVLGGLHLRAADEIERLRRERDGARAVAQSLVSYQDRINAAVEAGANSDLMEELSSHFDAVVEAARTLATKDTAP